MFHSRCALTGLVSILLAVATAPANITVFTFTDLAALPGGDRSTATSINDAGTVAGSSTGLNYYGDVVEQPVLWTGASPVSQERFYGYTQRVLAINNAGNFIKAYTSGADFDNSAITFPSESLNVMLHFDGKSFVGRDINNADQVIADDPAGGEAALFQTSGTYWDYSAEYLPFEQVHAINDGGQIVANQWVDLWNEDDELTYLNMHAYVYDHGTLTDIGHLYNPGGIQMANTTPEDINNHGVVVGDSLTASGDAHAFRWTSETGMVDLGTLGGSESVALAVNDLGIIVGSSVTADGATSAFAYAPFTGVMMDLNATLPAGSPWHLLSANDINRHGQIVGEAENLDGEIHAFKLSPTVQLSGAIANVIFDPDGFDPALYGQSGLPDGFQSLGAIIQLDGFLLTGPSATLSVLLDDELLGALGIDAGDVRLFWFDEIARQWVLAGAGSNLAPGGQFIDGPPTDEPGDWGVDGNSIWANIDHASSYGVFEIPEPAALPGDANGDGAVDIQDFVILKQNYGTSQADWPQGDFNADGEVNIQDFVILKQNYGRTVD